MSESQANQPRPSSYFDLHTEGIGYLNRVREVKPKKGEPFLACSISAMRGEAGSVEFTRFDVRVTGALAIQAVQGLRQDVEAKKAVIIGFRIGDLFVDTFVYDKDTQYHKKGDLGVMLKGRLLKIGFAKVDGQSVELPGSEPADQKAAA